MSASQGISHDFAVLALSYAPNSPVAPLGVAAATLVDLALDRKVSVVDDAVVLKDHRGCPLSVHEELRLVLEDKDALTPADPLISDHCVALMQAAHVDLAQDGRVVLRPDPRDPSRMRPPRLAPNAEREAFQTVKSLIMGTEEPQPQTAALTLLLDAAGLLRGMLPFVAKPVVDERLATIADAVEWPGHARKVLNLVLPTVSNAAHATQTAHAAQTAHATRGTSTS